MNETKFLSIAIDGPAAAGKTTLAKRLASTLGLTYVDTGAMYRAVALHSYRLCGMDLDRDIVARVLNPIDLDIVSENNVQRIYLDGEPIDDAELRQPHISILASDISVFSAVRAFLLDKQRAFARTADVVMEGRDIGSVVLPDASAKFYLTADLLVRAQRRYLDERKSIPDIDPLKVASDLARRDRNDMTRKEAPLRMCDGVIKIDSTLMTPDEVVDLVIMYLSNMSA